MLVSPGHYSFIIEPYNRVIQRGLYNAINYATWHYTGVKYLVKVYEIVISVTIKGSVCSHLISKIVIPSEKDAFYPFCSRNSYCTRLYNLGLWESHKVLYALIERYVVWNVDSVSMWSGVWLGYDGQSIVDSTAESTTDQLCQGNLTPTRWKEMHVMWQIRGDNPIKPNDFGKPPIGGYSRSQHCSQYWILDGHSQEREWILMCYSQASIAGVGMLSEKVRLMIRPRETICRISKRNSQAKVKGERCEPSQEFGALRGYSRIKNPLR